MTKLLIVDDEVEVREYVSNLSEWRTINCEVVGGAGNGEEALSQFERLSPEVIITDIRMPVMDGIEFARRVRRIDPKVPIIFLTAYDDFEYAREAIRLGVSDFVTKPFLPAELVDSVDVVRRTKNEHADMPENEELFAALVSDEMTQKEKQQRLSQEGILDSAAVLTYVEMDEQQNENRATFVRSMLKRSVATVLRSTQWEFLCATTSTGMYTLLCSRFGRELPDSDSLLQVATDIIENCSAHNQMSVSVAISRRIDHLWELKEAIAQTKECMEYRMIAGRKSALLYDELAERRHVQESERELFRGALADLLRDADFEGCRATVRAIFRSLLSINAGKKEIQRLCLDTIEISEKVLLEYGIADTAELSIDVRERALTFAILTDLMKYLEGHLERYTGLIRERQHESHSKIVASVRKIIEKEYTDDLSLRSVAARLHVSYSHLSRLIKKETGNNFSTLLWENRIREAKLRIAGSDLRAYEVGYAVGFKDPAHFSLLFKKVVGMTPNAYRLQITGGEATRTKK